jgi:hypothetical protein
MENKIRIAYLILLQYVQKELSIPIGLASGQGDGEGNLCAAVQVLVNDLPFVAARALDHFRLIRFEIHRTPLGVIANDLILPAKPTTLAKSSTAH